MAKITLTLLEADGRLPMVCMVCGREAVVIRHKTFAWHPWWVFFSSPFTLFPAAATHYAALQAPLCEAHRSCWEARRWISIGGFVLLTIAAVVLGVQISQSALMIAWWTTWILALLSWLFATLFLSFTAIRAIKITNSHLVLSGVSREFINAKEDCDRGPDKLRQQLITGYGPAHWSNRGLQQPQESETGIHDKSRRNAAADDAIRE